MYVSYSGDDLGRPSLHLRPSTVEQNQVSGVYNTLSKRKRGEMEALDEFSAVWRPKKEDGSADWWCSTSSVSMDLASSIISVYGEVICIESDGKGL